ncbi:MAG TPA: hypothetical protein VNA57_10270 [Acidimicrobiales bacterium]|nr:hypothetical protein [Acidimicrobiales bacterium]
MSTQSVNQAAAAIVEAPPDPGIPVLPPTTASPDDGEDGSGEAAGAAAAKPAKPTKSSGGGPSPLVVSSVLSALIAAGGVLTEVRRR